ncbi:MAG TPA: NfeD family protein [Terriglobia bacterium]|nr:NfeD family protein [Terriglobia bacterium]
MDWWMWFVLGFALLMLEMATPGGFYFIFFGASAFLVAMLDLTGIIESAWMEWMLFSIFAAGATTVFRQRVLNRFGPRMPNEDVDTLIGEVATALEGIQPGAIGKAELRGSSWTAFNAGSRQLERGQRCRVERVDGLTLFIRAAEPGSSSH